MVNCNAKGEMAGLAGPGRVGDPPLRRDGEFLARTILYQLPGTLSRVFLAKSPGIPVPTTCN